MPYLLTVSTSTFCGPCEDILYSLFQEYSYTVQLYIFMQDKHSALIQYLASGLMGNLGPGAPIGMPGNGLPGGNGPCGGPPGGGLGPPGGNPLYICQKKKNSK